jgi:hypothetical protein
LTFKCSSVNHWHDWTDHSLTMKLKLVSCWLAGLSESHSVPCFVIKKGWLPQEH